MCIIFSNIIYTFKQPILYVCVVAASDALNILMHAYSCISFTFINSMISSLFFIPNIMLSRSMPSQHMLQ